MSSCFSSTLGGVDAVVRVGEGSRRNVLACILAGTLAGRWSW